MFSILQNVEAVSDKLIIAGRLLKLLPCSSIIDKSPCHADGLTFFHSSVDFKDSNTRDLQNAFTYGFVLTP